MRRCGTLRRFMVRRRSAGAETAGARSVGRVSYLRNLQNTSTRTDARVSAGRLSAAVQGCKWTERQIPTRTCTMLQVYTSLEFSSASMYRLSRKAYGPLQL